MAVRWPRNASKSEWLDPSKILVDEIVDDSSACSVQQEGGAAVRRMCRAVGLEEPGAHKAMARDADGRSNGELEGGEEVEW